VETVVFGCGRFFPLIELFSLRRIIRLIEASFCSYLIVCVLVPICIELKPPRFSGYEELLVLLLHWLFGSIYECLPRNPDPPPTPESSAQSLKSASYAVT
jgi:hypothetical protein